MIGTPHQDAVIRFTLNACPRCGERHEMLPWYRLVKFGRLNHEGRRPPIWSVCPRTQNPLTGFLETRRPVNTEKLILPEDPRIVGGLG